jgi:hypothetical protein
VWSFNKSFEDRRDGAGLGRIKRWPRICGSWGQNPNKYGIFVKVQAGETVSTGEVRR